MNVKQGDLAILTKSRTGKSVGMIVEVAGFWGIHKKLGAMWNVITPRATVGSSLNGKHRKQVPAGGLMQHPDDWMRPVSGLPVDEPTETEKPIEELA